MIEYIKYQAPNLFNDNEQEDQEDSFKFVDAFDYLKDFVSEGIQQGKNLITKTVYIPNRFQEDPEEVEEIQETEDENKEEKKEEKKVEPSAASNVNGFSEEYKRHLLSLDIEDLLKSQGITHIGKKAIKFGRKGLRPQNASYGAKNSNHKKRDPHTGNAMARDISIPNGSDADYAAFRKMLLGNKKVRDWMVIKGWGIINEITTAALKRTRGTGRHFHFGPDRWAKRTWQAWINNPNIPVTTICKEGGTLTHLEKRKTPINTYYI